MYVPRFGSTTTFVGSDGRGGRAFGHAVAWGSHGGAMVVPRRVVPVAVGAPPLPGAYHDGYRWRTSDGSPIRDARRDTRYGATSASVHTMFGSIPGPSIDDLFPEAPGVAERRAREDRERRAREDQAAAERRERRAREDQAAAERRAADADRRARAAQRASPVIALLNRARDHQRRARDTVSLSALRAIAEKVDNIYARALHLLHDGSSRVERNAVIEISSIAAFCQRKCTAHS